MNHAAQPKNGLVEEARQFLAVAAQRNLTVRLMGGIAFDIRCPGQVEVFRRFERRHEDFDIVAIGRQANKLRDIFPELGYVEDPHVYVNSAGTRSVAFREGAPTHLDVFFDDLEFCHTIPMKGRLEVEELTLPLAELVMQKLQIVQINRKDLIDLVALLLEYAVGTEDVGTINAERIAGLTSEDWGLWRTATMNLDNLEQFAATASEMDEAQRALVKDRLAELRTSIDARPKSLRWRMRAKVGDRVKWYREMEDLRPGEGGATTDIDQTGSGNATP
jgi:hypothetical protein